MAMSGIAATVNQTDRFSCDFTDRSDPEAWTIVDINGPDYWTDGNCWKQAFDSWNKCMFLHCDDGPADDWLISPKVTLSGGNYTIVMRYKELNDASMVTLTMGSEPTVEAQTKVIEASKVLTNTDYNYVVYTVEVSDCVAGDWYFGIHNHSTRDQNGRLYINLFEVAKTQIGSIAVSLVDDKTGAPLPDVSLSLSAEGWMGASATTDADGKAKFEKLGPATYSLSYSSSMLEAAEPTLITLEQDEAKEVTVQAKAREYATLTGCICDYNWRVAPGARVTLGRYSATTDDGGNFTINNIAPGVYDMVVEYPMNKRLVRNMNIEIGDVWLGDVQMEALFGAPRNVQASSTPGGVLVSWMMPVLDAEFSYDNGEIDSQYSLGNQGYHQFGNIFRQPISVREIKWAVDELRGNVVDLHIYLIDEQGHISTTPVWSATEVPATRYDWEGLKFNSYTLETPVFAPNGCVVAVGKQFGPDSGMSICTQYGGTNDYSFVLREGGNWYTPNRGTFFIRVLGEEFSGNVVCRAPSRAPTAFSTSGLMFEVTREAASLPDEAPVTETLTYNHKGLYLLDTEYTPASTGNLVYSVMAKHQSCGNSEAVKSAPIEINQATAVVASVVTNAAAVGCDGATVTLTDNEGRAYTATVVDGQAEFAAVPRRVYNVKVEKYGFQTAEIYSEDFRYADTHKPQYYLEMQPLEPFALKAVQIENTPSVVLNWNSEDGRTEDCENMTPFAANPVGEAGWQFADGDGHTTYAITNCTYTNAGTPKAFMAFAPEATEPSTVAYLQPHSGKMMLAAVSPDDDSRADDWAISPALDPEHPSQLSFWAASGFYAMMGKEEFMVGYTTAPAAEGTVPTEVVWLTEEPLTVGASWTHFSYDLPVGACNAVIRYVSAGKFFFLLDDMFTGRREADVFNNATFIVQLDGEEIATTASRSLCVNDLEAGTHLLKVQAAYPVTSDDGYTTVYSTQSQLRFSVAENSGITNVEADTEAAEYFNLQGIKVDPATATPGLYIERRGAVSRLIKR